MNLWILLLLIVIVMSVLAMNTYLIYLHTKENPTVKLLLEAQQNLLNRLQAGDLRTYLALQTSEMQDDDKEEYTPRDDESEADRIVALGGVEFDDLDSDIRQAALEDFGAVFDRDVHGQK